MCTAFALADADAGLLEQIVLGVLVSLLAAAVTWLIAAATRRGRSFINRLFGVVIVQGTWQTRLTRGGGGSGGAHERAELQQLLNRVWGRTETWPKPPAGSMKYKVRGWIQGQNLILTYRSSGGPGYDCGAIVLRITHDWDEMKGYEAGPDAQTETKEIKAFVYEWAREGSDAAKSFSAKAPAAGDAHEKLS